MSADAQDALITPGNDAGGPEPSANRQEAAAPPTEAEPDSTAEATDEVPQTKPKPKLCGICDKVEAKYKCPRCALP
jgi:hypothetical protein